MNGNPTQAQTSQLLTQAQQALDAQQFVHCVELCNQILDRDTVNLAAHRMRGIASGQTGNMSQAIADLAFSLERKPNDLAAAFFLGRALRATGQFDLALNQLRPALEDAQLKPHVQFEIARCQRGQGRIANAIQTYRSLLQLSPSHADAAANLAALLEQVDQLEDALSWAERAVVLAPNNSGALLTRARINRQLGHTTTAETQLNQLLKGQLSPLNQTLALNQLGNCKEQQGQFDEAFVLFTQANELQRANDPDFDLDDHGSYGIELVRYLTTWLEEHPADSWSPTPEDTRDAPVFLLGFNQSGGETLAKHLSRHSKIEVLSGRELLLEVRRKWVSVDHFHRIQDMTAEEVHEARRHYWQARAAAYKNPDAQVVIDQLPLNVVYLALIHRIFPRAKFIFTTRDPRDACLSCFSQSFSLAGATPYFLDLDRTTQYFDAVNSLAQHARKNLSLDECEVRYENVVSQPEEELRQVIGFLELDWEEAVTTNGVNHPDRPLDHHAVGRWKNYSSQLTAFEPVLNPWVDILEYAKTS